MLSAERQRRLLRHLHEHGSGDVAALADALGVSTSTVRRDLNDLDERGLLVRVHGGASVLDTELEPTLRSRAAVHGEQKRRIAAAAASRVPDGSVLLVTGGTTTAAMLPFLGDRDGLTVVTNGLDIARHLARYPKLTVVVLGGVLRHDELSLLGPIAEQVLAEFHVDLAVCSAYGIDAEDGLSGAHVSEAGTDRRMLAAADSLVVLADSSKFGRRGPVRVADVERIACVITDDAAPADQVQRLREQGVEVVVC